MSASHTPSADPTNGYLGGLPEPLRERLAALTPATRRRVMKPVRARLDELVADPRGATAHELGDLDLDLLAAQAERTRGLVLAARLTLLALDRFDLAPVVAAPAHVALYVATCGECGKERPAPSSRPVAAFCPACLAERTRRRARGSRAVDLP